ncbi:hypothetical protein ACFQH3_19475 [Haladaptatus sp. GCM10025707]
MTKTDGGYEGTIPGEYIVPEWDLQVYFSTIDETDNGLLVPGLYHADEPAPYYVVAVTTE